MFGRGACIALVNAAMTPKHSMVAAVAALLLGCSDDKLPFEGTLPDGKADDIAGDTTVVGEIGANETKSDVFVAGHYVGFTFSGGTGQVVTLALRSTDRDPVLFLFGPRRGDGTWPSSYLVMNDDADGLNSKIGDFALPADGAYLAVAAEYNLQSGSFELTLNTMPAASTCDLWTGCAPGSYCYSTGTDGAGECRSARDLYDLASAYAAERHTDFPVPQDAAAFIWRRVTSGEDGGWRAIYVVDLELASGRTLRVHFDQSAQSVAAQPECRMVPNAFWPTVGLPVRGDEIYQSCSELGRLFVQVGADREDRQRFESDHPEYPVLRDFGSGTLLVGTEELHELEAARTLWDSDVTHSTVRSVNLDLIMYATSGRSRLAPVATF